MVNMSKAFRPLFLLSLGLATLAVVTPLAVGPANASLAIRVSIVSAASWIATVVYAFAKFKKRGLWFLLGTPLIFAGSSCFFWSLGVALTLSEPVPDGWTMSVIAIFRQLTLLS
jgi:hypothetical protein